MQDYVPGPLKIDLYTIISPSTVDPGGGRTVSDGICEARSDLGLHHLQSDHYTDS
jgi:hypothetical protein